MTPFPGYQDYALLLLRIVMGAIYIVHGLPKIKKPGDFAGFLRSMNVPLPETAAYLVALLEFAGGALLIVGGFTAWLGLLFAVEMLVAINLVRRKFVGGWEFDLLLLASGVLLFLTGAGGFSVDAYVARLQ